MKKINENSVMKNASKYFAVALLLLLCNSSHAANYYWVGGTGNWTDFANHWATSSGGAIFHVQEPTINDNVYFDDNSFSFSGTDTVFIFSPTTPSCNNFSFINNLPIARGGFASSPLGGQGISFLIQGNLSISGSIANYGFSNNDVLLFSFWSTQAVQFIQTSGNRMNIDLYSSNTATYNLLDDLDGSFLVRSGRLNTNGHTLNITSFLSRVEYQGIIDFGNSNINSFVDPFNSFEVCCGGRIIADNATFNLPVTSFVHNNNNTASATVKEITAKNIYIINDTIGVCSITGIAKSVSSTVSKLNLNGSSAVFYNDTSALSGTNNHIGNFVMNADTCSIDGFLAGLTTLIDTLVVNTSCNNLVLKNGYNTDVSSELTISTTPSLTTIRSDVAGAPTIITKNNGTLCFDYLSVKDVTATGGAQFFAGANSVNSGVNSGWNFASCPLQPIAYYWVGGTGNWNDFTNHWATTSGGNVFHAAPPGASDDVFFDNNSFLSNTDTVYDSGYNQCNSFHLNSGFIPYFYFTTYATSSVEMHTIIDGLIGFVFKGTGTGNTILTGGNNCVLQFDSAGTWQLSDDFSGYISMLAPATLYTNSHAVNINETDFLNQNGGIIYFGSSIVTMSSPNSILYSQSPAQIFGDSASFYINGLFSHYQGLSDHSFKYINAKNISLLNDTVEKMVFSDSLLNFSGCHLKELEVASASSNALLQNGDLGYADNYIQKLILYGSSCVFKTDSNAGVFNTGWHIDTLFMANGGASITIDAGDTIYINDQFFKNGNNIGTIQSSAFGQSAYMYKSTGSVCLDYMEISDNSAIGGATFNAGANSINATNNNGWLFTACTNLSDVWPGDANYDLTVNNFDVLNLGLAYNETGPVRSGTSLAYVAQPATDWSGYFQTAVNKKHADTNGDGIVDDNDTTAILLNYGLTHPARMGNTQLTASPTDPYLYISVNPDSANLNDTIYIETFFGTSQIPVDSVYGLAFTINYDTTLVDTSWISTQFLNSWFGQPGIDLITFSKSIPLEQKIDVAIVRTDHNNTTGFGGPLCRTGIVIVDNVAGRMPLPITLSNARALTASEYELAINIGGDTVSVDTTTTGIVQHGDPTFAVRLFPNPAKNKLYVVTNSNSVYNYQLLDMFGNSIFFNKGAVPQKTFFISSPGKGMYILQLLTSNGMVARKVVFME